MPFLPARTLRVNRSARLRLLSGLFVCKVIQSRFIAWSEKRSLVETAMSASNIFRVKRQAKCVDEKRWVVHVGFCVEDYAQQSIVKLVGFNGFLNKFKELFARVRQGGADCFD